MKNRIIFRFALFSIVFESLRLQLFFVFLFIQVDGYFGDPQDCRVFHTCIDGHDFRSMCGNGLAWEPILRLCMPTQQVSSCQSSKSFETSSPGE